MSLPQITVPAGTPVFLADGHAIEQLPAFSDVQTGSGHGRKRRTRSSPPRRVSVSLNLNAAAMQAFDAWFEDTLQVGQLSFSARVANQGPGLMWWEAKWVEPYTAEPRGFGKWRVTGTLFLSGEPSSDGPTITSLGLEVSLALKGSGSIVSDTSLAVEYSLALLTALSLGLEMTFSIDALASAGSVIATPGAGSLSIAGKEPSAVIQFKSQTVVQFACSDEVTPIALGQLISLPILTAMSLTRVVATLVTPQSTGSLLTIDIKKNGTTIFSTLLTFDNTESTTATASTSYVLSTTTLAIDDVITVSVTQVGDGTAAGLKVGLVGS